ncbi:MAG: response regulator, partial [Chloroflexota bacterium]|nr:response regulator [Chloroflexota bacterium]
MTLQPLKALLIEDNEADAELVIRQLRDAGFDPQPRRIERPDELRAALAETSWDVILSDHSMPDFGSAEALLIVREMERDIPFVIVSGQIGERAAVEVMRAGARDYVSKSNLERLGVIVQRELASAELRRRARRRDEERRILYEIASSGRGLVDREQFCDNAVVQLSRFMGVERTHIYWWDAAGSVLRLSSTAAAGEPARAELRAGEGAAGAAFANREPVVVAEELAWPDAIVSTGTERSVAAFPLIGSTTTLGVVVVTMREVAITPDDLS